MMYLNERHLLPRTVTLLGPTQAPSPTSSSSSSTTTSSLATSTSSLDAGANPPQSTAPTTASKAAAPTKSSGIGTGPIIGIVIGGVALLAVIGFLIWFCLGKRRKQRGDLFVRGTSTTPMIGSNRAEKFAMDDDTPDLEQIGEERQRGGVFGPFGGLYPCKFVHISIYSQILGYQRTASREIQESRRFSQSLDVNDENDIADARIRDPEKASFMAPPINDHPALHPLPGQTANIPTYYPGGASHPAYTRNHLPSQRGRQEETSLDLPIEHPDIPRPPFASEREPSSSPQIPDFVFSPIELVPGADRMDNVPITPADDAVPLTPQAELAAFPSPPTTIPSHMPSFAQRLKQEAAPPRHTFNRPRRQSTPPRHSAPLERLTPPHISTMVMSSQPGLNSAPLIERGSNPMKSFTGLQISGLQRKPTGRTLNVRPRGTTYPSPTAGGRPELPASFPTFSSPSRPKLPKSMPSIQKTPRNMISSRAPMPAFNHISLPSPVSSTLGRNESTNTTYSIPIALDSKSRRQSKSQTQDLNWPLTNHPVTSDAHHLREQPSAISELSTIRDTQNSSAVSAMSSLSPEATTPGGALKHNHSREFHEDESHVMSWQNYSERANIGARGVGQKLMGGDHDEVSPMFSPPIDGHGNGLVSPLTMGQKTPAIGGYGGYNNNSVVSPMTVSAKTPSQQSLDEREREREEYFGDLSVRPLNRKGLMGRLNTRRSGGSSRKT
jgi:hypothetical protein